MFALPGLLGLVAFIILKPQEFVDELRGIPFLYVFFALAALGLLTDVLRGFHRPQANPQWRWVLFFGLWCLLTLVIRAPSAIPSSLVTLLILCTIFAGIAFGVNGFSSFEVLSGGVLASTMFVAAFTAQQGTAPWGCVAIDDEARESINGIPDGRPCVSALDCRQESPEPNVIYRCEHIGWFGLTSTGSGRVRYVGVLQDPNDTALAVGIGVPLAFGFFQRKRSIPRGFLVLGACVLAALCTVLTRSRGGQLVFMTVLGVYFVKRFGVRGLLVAAMLAVPVFLYGGRAGAEADSSSQERIECMYAGVHMWLHQPFLGVGFGRFTDHYRLTAHNSFVLAPAELGLPGMLLWSMVLYVSVKIPWHALRCPPLGVDDEAMQAWATALLASFCGLLVGIFFLSFNYNHVLWVFLGLSGALNAVAKAHDPDWRVELGYRDALTVLGIDLALLLVLFAYTRGAVD